MREYTREELEQAMTAIRSAVSKIEKIREKETLGTSQRTLIERRLNAFQIALELIEMKLQATE
jgi:hypothetical protein